MWGEHIHSALCALCLKKRGFMATTYSTSSLNFPEFCSAGAMRSEGCSRNTLALLSGCPFSIPVSKPSRSSDFCHPHATSNLSKSCRRISDAVLFPHPLLFPFTDVPCTAGAPALRSVQQGWPEQSLPTALSGSAPSCILVSETHLYICYLLSTISSPDPSPLSIYRSG